MRKLILLTGLFLTLTNCGDCTKECAYCDGTGITTIGPSKGSPCRPCEGDGCWSDQTSIGR